MLYRMPGSAFAIRLALRQLDATGGDLPVVSPHSFQHCLFA